jgi:hypothetical protein
MPCNVTLTDNSFSPVRHPRINIEAFIPAPISKSIQTLNNTALPSGAYGATLTLISSTDVYDVIIHTVNTTYAPLTIRNLSGGGAPQLDLVLDSTASATAAGSTYGRHPTSSTAVAPFVMGQFWPDEGKRAVLTCVSTLSYVNRASFRGFDSLQRWLENLLDSLGIDPNLA